MGSDSIAMPRLMRGGGRVNVESVTNGHPDKVCDQISDAMVDAALADDPNSRVAMETAGKNIILLFGEMTTKSIFDPRDVAKRVYREIGYDPDTHVMDRVVFLADYERQSPDIALINDPDQQGAGDQGGMCGYAVNQPDYNFMPPVIMIAHRLTSQLQLVREDGSLEWVRPDGKSQVTMEDGKIVQVTIAIQHEDMDLDELRRDVHEHVIVPIVGDFPFDKCTINGTGAFVLGGFAADSGLTGRKIVVDQYGMLVEVGGGCFSGKDPTKVDRTAAYMCRHITKNIMTHNKADEALVKLAFTINGKGPDMFSVETPDGQSADLESWAREHFPLSPGGMIEYFGMQKPEGWSYQDVAAYGHFGRNQFPWERIVSL